MAPRSRPVGLTPRLLCAQGTAAQNSELVRLVQSLRHELESSQKANAELGSSLEDAERRARASMNAAADDACVALCCAGVGRCGD